MKCVIITGMSGAGKSTAFKMMEDLGYYCVDNLPIPLFKSFMELSDQAQSEVEKVALGIDIRNGQNLEQLSGLLDELDARNAHCEILYLDAAEEALIKRYKETRRSHPLSRNERVELGIEAERERLSFLKKRADYIIDTTHLLTRELKEELEKIFVQNTDYKSLFITVLSFGFKYGIPADADLVFDVRFLPNPYYVEGLREKTGNDPEIQSFLAQYSQTSDFEEKLCDMINFLIPNYISEGKNQLVIAIGCTGGKHRSVTIANDLYERLSSGAGYGLKLSHRDIDKDSKRGK